MSDPPRDNRKRPASGGRISNPVLVGIRRGFYDGVARTCLEQAWFALDAVRQQKPIQRLFRGKMQWRNGVPLLDIATKLGRDVGTICRWFRGESPEWPNLLMAMTALDTDWKDIGRLPSKTERIAAGHAWALFRVQNRVLHKGEKNLPGPAELERLTGLFNYANWAFDRRIPRRRATSLERIAADLGDAVGDLDAVDGKWGEAWIWCLKAYAESLDPSVWRKEG